MIHYLRIGLLKLPDGATLRSYLAHKLNCDPMRITKKYAGASCLGRRVYHHRDRISHQPPTVPEIHLARAELDALEGRFRTRAEGWEGGSLGPTVDTSSTSSSLLAMPPIPSAPNAASLAQSMGFVLQQQQQAAAFMAAQQNVAPTAPNPLQALLLSFAVAAASGQHPAMAPATAPPSQPIIAPAVAAPCAPGMPQPLNPQALVSWLAQMSPSQTANGSSVGLPHAIPSAPAPTQHHSTVPQVQSALSGAGGPAQPSANGNNTIAWLFPQGTMTNQQAPAESANL